MNELSGELVEHGRLARWINWRAYDVGEAKEGLENDCDEGEAMEGLKNELWRR